MSGIDPISALTSVQNGPATAQALAPPGTFAFADALPCDAAHASASESFAGLLSRGVAEVEARVDRADQLVRNFVVDASIPVHEVTIALEQARVAVELAVQVRTRLVEGYRDIMNMQL